MGTDPRMKGKRDSPFPEVEDYFPELTKKLMSRIEAGGLRDVGFYGFGENMKWLTRILSAADIEVSLYDWRGDLVGFDCGSKIVRHVCEIDESSEMTLVITADDISTTKEGIHALIDNGVTRIPVIYETASVYNPYFDEPPYSDIAKRAVARAVSVISAEKLFNIMQYVRETAQIPGNIVEYGCFNGGSAAVIVEASRHFDREVRSVKLFDTFEGIPAPKYGLDARWDRQFSNNSFAEVSKAFADCDNVEIIKGDLRKTYREAGAPMSFCHIAIDTMEAAETLLEHCWPLVGTGGIVAVDDYGSFPNCLPLTVMTDRFVAERSDAFVYGNAVASGIFLMKR